MPIYPQNSFLGDFIRAQKRKNKTEKASILVLVNHHTFTKSVRKPAPLILFRTRKKYILCESGPYDMLMERLHAPRTCELIRGEFSNLPTPDLLRLNLC